MIPTLVTSPTTILVLTRERLPEILTMISDIFPVPVTEVKAELLIKLATSTNKKAAPANLGIFLSEFNLFPPTV